MLISSTHQAYTDRRQTLVGSEANFSDGVRVSSSLSAPKSTAFGAVLRKVSVFFLRMVDSGIPVDMRTGDSDTLRRARIILSFTLILILLGLDTVMFFSWALDPSAAFRVKLALLGALLLTLTIPMVFRRTGSLTVATNLVITASFIVVFTIFTVIGGINAPLLHWCALFPMLAALMGSRTSAWIWAAVGFSTIGFFVIADVVGWQFPDIVGFAQLEGFSLWFQRFVNVGSWLGILLAVALLYEDHKNEQTSKLVAKNAELESEIEQRYKAEQLSHYLAHYDELTGLANRRLFLEQLSAAIEQTFRTDRIVGVLFLDLDCFKEVNDMHGHALGDQLLQQVAKRLQHCVRLADQISHAAHEELGDVARLGGDEFTILLHGIRDHRDAAIVAQRILDSLGDTFTLEGLELFIGTSIGIALCSNELKGSDVLLRNADLAMYQAKSAGKNNFKFFEESMNEDIIKRSTMTDALRKALEGGELELHFQPIIDAHTRLIVGVEALARWNRPEYGFVSPEVFIRIAEESGLIIQLGEWVVRDACRHYQQWRAEGLALQRIAINVSGVQFKGGGIVDTVQAALSEFDMDPSCLEIEVTEGAMMADEDETSRVLGQLKRLGMKVALDDFGTGYSSLSYAHRFPVDGLKIDRSFVAEVESDQSSQAIVTAVIAMAHQLGLKVVGEGVENEQQECFLREHGCDELQGYRFSRPVPGEEIARLLCANTTFPRSN